MTAKFVQITNGRYRNKPVNGIYELIKPHWKTGAGKTFVQVNLVSEMDKKGDIYELDVQEVQDEFGGQSVQSARVTVGAAADLEYKTIDGEVVEQETVTRLKEIAEETKGKAKEAVWEEIEDDTENETKDQAIERIRSRFERLDLMTGAVIEGHIRGLIVSGPPGIGKSYGVEQLLDEENAGAFVGEHNKKFEIVKGSISAPGLYQMLYKHSERGHVVVFDDCDSVFEDVDCLNMLKAVLDSGDRRRVSWTKESRWLDREDLPTYFDFEAGVIFLTNVNLDREMAKGNKRAAHLNALVSRSHFVDLGIDTLRDVFLRIEQITMDGLLQQFKLYDGEDRKVLEFIRANHHRLRELSLRTVLKLAQLFKVDEDNWEELAIETTCMPNGRGRLLAA